MLTEQEVKTRVDNALTLPASPVGRARHVLRLSRAVQEQAATLAAIATAFLEDGDAEGSRLFMEAADRLKALLGPLRTSACECLNSGHARGFGYLPQFDATPHWTTIPRHPWRPSDGRPGAG